MPLGTAILFIAVAVIVVFISRKDFVAMRSVGSIAVVLVAFVIATLPPNADKEFDRVFGSENRALASEIESLEAFLINGHLLSFRIEKSDFDSRIRPRFEKESSFDLLQGMPLPDGWPSSVETAERGLRKQQGDQEVLVFYDEAVSTAFASVSEIKEWESQLR